MKERITHCIFCCFVFFAIEATGQTIAISEVQYDPDSTMQSEDWIEIHNYGAETVDIGSWKLEDEAGNTFFIPNETTLAAGSFLVLAQDQLAFSNIYPSVTNVIGSFGFGLNNIAGSVILYDDDEDIVRQVNYIDSLPWPNGADGLGPSLEIENYTGDESDPSNWFAGCVGGSPGTAYTECDYDLVVSEINYNSVAGFEMGEWIELWNRSSSAIDISGWMVKDNDDDNIYVIPGGNILDPDERIVIADSLEAMAALFPGVTNIAGEFSFGLSNNGDAVRIYDQHENIRYSIRYDDELPWPTDADGEGFTMELYVEAGNPNLAENWVAGCPFGSPGKPFILPCPTSIKDNETSEKIIRAMPNPFSDVVMFDCSGVQMHDISAVRMHNLFGQHVADLSLSNQITWDGLDVSGNPVAEGIYFLQITYKSGNVSTTQVVKM